MNTKTKLYIALGLSLFVGYVLYSRKEVVVESIVEAPKKTHGVVEAPKKLEQVPKKPEETTSLSEELTLAMDELPTVNDLSNLSTEELHHTPEMVLEGGMLVGEMIEKAEADPARRQETLKFLKDCAENNDVVHQIRAVCWRKTLAQIPEWKLFLPISDANVPDDIKDLAMKLP